MHIRPLIYLPVILGCFLGLSTACNRTSRSSSDAQIQSATRQQQDTPAPAFDAKQAHTFIKEQCDFGPRVPNSQAHQTCGEYLAAQFESFGCTVTNQYADLKAFDGTVLKGRNIIASVNPEATQRILLCAHWDSRPWADNDSNPDKHRTPIDGANDGASGVAVMLEIARQIQQHPVGIGIDFICFDAEDYGRPSWEPDEQSDEMYWCLGSQHWAAHPHVKEYKARFGILMDMVGGRGNSFAQEMVSLYYAPQVVRNVWNTAHRLGYGDYFPKSQGGYLIDDHVPVNQIAGIPCIDIVPHHEDGPSSFGATWHTVDDTPENIDPLVLKAVGQTVMQVIYNENSK